jgi:hypothetical protein
MLDVHAHYDDQFLKQFDLLRVYSGSPVCTENLSSGVVVVKSAKDGV